MGVGGVEFAARHRGEERVEFAWIHQLRLLTLLEPTGNINHCAI
jgi:hypothetical protein